MTRKFFWAVLACLVFVIGCNASVGADATVGQPAPAFSGTDSHGKTHNLSDFKGKYVVLEWYNPDCPIVRSKYDPGVMQKLQQEYTKKGIVWLSIDSSAPGKQGHLTPEQANAAIKKEKGAPTALLLDPEGKIGRLYGAKTTPHMFIIDPQGKLIYNGAIDDKANNNYVRTALDEVLAGKAVSNPTTQPYGCSVKY
ncbi:MAG: thioredoxin family protein [Blastocatellia bacterium]|nr:thioredoxin family protein [Blastocatellia bacterium]